LSVPGADGTPDVENRCKNCGRYIGPIVTCPFCGHRVRRHSRITITKYVAITFAVVGLLALQVFTMFYGTPPMDINQLGETSNYAYVELSGVVSRAPVYYPAENGGPGTIYFTVDDGTGQISVRAYPVPVVKDMLATGKIPAMGDRVNVSGSVYWYNAERGFILNSLAQLKIDRPEAVNMSVGEISALDPEAMLGYYRVRTYGIVTSWRKYYSATDISITDEKANEISVYIPNSIFDLTGVGALGTLDVGMGLEVEGCLEYYDAGSYSKWEIIPGTSQDMRRAKPDLKVVDVRTSDLTFPLNQQFTVNVTVLNLGPLPLTGSTLQIVFDGEVIYNTMLQPLAPGENEVVTLDTAVTDGRSSLGITVTVAPPAPLEDLDPADNTYTLQGVS
jgi:hypothetical protein